MSGVIHHRAQSVSGIVESGGRFPLMTFNLRAVPERDVTSILDSLQSAKSAPLARIPCYSRRSRLLIISLRMKHTPSALVDKAPEGTTQAQILPNVPTASLNTVRIRNTPLTFQPSLHPVSCLLVPTCDSRPRKTPSWFYP